MADLESIQKKISAFRNERDWSQFHNPKNLAEALSINIQESGIVDYTQTHSNVFRDDILYMDYRWVVTGPFVYGGGGVEPRNFLCG